MSGMAVGISLLCRPGDARKTRPGARLIGFERPATPQITERIEKSGLDLPGPRGGRPRILADRHTEQHGEQPVPPGTAITAAMDDRVQIGCLPELHLPENSYERKRGQVSFSFAGLNSNAKRDRGGKRRTSLALRVGMGLTALVAGPRWRFGLVWDRLL
jgi:hypothetical protein